MSNRAKVLDIPIDLTNLSEVINTIKERIKDNKKTHIITVNSEIAMLSKSDSEFKNILINSDLNVADGSGIVWALKKKKINIEKLAGIELAENCIKHIPNSRIFFLGAKEEIVSKAFENMSNKYKNNNLIAYRNGYFNDEDEEEIIKQINDLEIDILLIALGAPKQDKWILKNKNKINAKIFIGVGGSFDVFSGKINRAPKLMINLQLEWLYRLYKDPSRWKRSLAIPKFMFTFLKENRND